MERCMASPVEGAGAVGAELVGIEVAGLGAVRYVTDEQAGSRMQLVHRGIVTVEGAAQVDDVSMARCGTTSRWCRHSRFPPRRE